MMNHPWTEVLATMMNEIRREDGMPQIEKGELKDTLKRIQNHCEVSFEMAPCADLKPIQENAIKDKIEGIANDLGDTPLKEWPPILISEDNFIVDGHHRWLAAISLHEDSASIPAFKIHLPKVEALKIVKRMESVQELQEGKRLAVFDFDNTLVTTSSKVHVRHGKLGDILYSLAPHEYNDHKKKPHEEYDFTEFTDDKLRNPSTIRKIFRFFKDFAKRQNKSHKTIILTARGAHKPIKNWLREIGLHDVFVVALDSKDPHDKARWIENEINRGFDRILFYDDKIENIRAVEELRDKYPHIRLKTTHVKH